MRRWEKRHTTANDTKMLQRRNQRKGEELKYINCQHLVLSTDTLAINPAKNCMLVITCVYFVK